MRAKGLTLVANGRSTKSINFDKATKNDDPELKKGILQGNTCSSCRCTTILSNTIKCGQCQSAFHIDCTFAPINSDVVELVKNNPCIWWLCLDCMYSACSKKGNVTNTPKSNEVDLPANLEDTISHHVKKNCEA